MATTRKDILIAWLRDAHAMESDLINMLEKQSGKLDSHPDLQRRFKAHAEESKAHAEKIEKCLNGLDSGTSSLKEGIAKLAGKMGPSAMSASADTPVKMVLASLASEHFEIACYTSLRTAAEHCGETSISRIVEGIIEEEKAMAKFLEDQIERVTMSHLEHESDDGAATQNRAKAPSGTY